MSLLTKGLGVFVVLALLFLGCKSNKEGMAANKQEASRPDFSAGPPTMVYKTKQDYTDKVAVMLSEDKKAIVAYPHPRDIAAKIDRVRPTVLENGYLLDAQGINRQVAFTRYTFEEYAALPEAPSIEELQASIIEKDPLVEMWHCGNRHQYKAIVSEINKLIAGGFVGCKKLLPKE